MQAWITGIRKDQTLNRFDTQLVEWDEGNSLVKINPLYRWTEKMVWDYIHEHGVPYNELHDKKLSEYWLSTLPPGQSPRVRNTKRQAAGGGR